MKSYVSTEGNLYSKKNYDYLKMICFCILFSRMQCPAEQPKKTVLKRARNPPKRFDELAPGSPKDDQDGN